jgi:predicted nucleotide-binding protein
MKLFVKSMNVTLDYFETNAKWNFNKTEDRQSEKGELESMDNDEKTNNIVFIVHGHTQLIRIEIENLVLRVGLRPVVLHKEDDKGRTIIEKFEQESKGACFAIILFTGDDIGASCIEYSEKKEEALQKRARQNVVFECGYFYGKIGRNKVFLIREEGVELPSDLNAIVYSTGDTWKNKLLNEMRAAGVPIDEEKAKEV